MEAVSLFWLQPAATNISPIISANNLGVTKDASAMNPLAAGAPNTGRAYVKRAGIRKRPGDQAPKKPSRPSSPSVGQECICTGGSEAC